MHQKFDLYDRKKVISEIEKHFNITLTQIGNRKKWLQDQNGRSFWVLGGYENWHGIPPEMMEMENTKANGKLIIAEKEKDRINIFSGDLGPFIKNKKTLSRTEKGDYHFHIYVKGGHLFIKEIPDCVLKKIVIVSYTKEDKKSDKKNHETFTRINNLVRDLPADKRNTILNLFNVEQI